MFHRHADNLQFSGSVCHAYTMWHWTIIGNPICSGSYNGLTLTKWYILTDIQAWFNACTQYTLTHTLLHDPYAYASRTCLHWHLLQCVIWCRVNTDHNEYHLNSCSAAVILKVRIEDYPCTYTLNECKSAKSADSIRCLTTPILCWVNIMAPRGFYSKSRPTTWVCHMSACRIGVNIVTDW